MTAPVPANVSAEGAPAGRLRAEPPQRLPRLQGRTLSPLLGRHHRLPEITLAARFRVAHPPFPPHKAAPVKIISPSAPDTLILNNGPITLAIFNNQYLLFPCLGQSQTRFAAKSLGVETSS
ncbi:MAG: hypothetical protein HS126_35275 [Anaerolineales bacterium]|nr:hypothetical protein [Anaerolineales bacterium]